MSRPLSTHRETSCASRPPPRRATSPTANCSAASPGPATRSVRGAGSRHGRLVLSACRRVLADPPTSRMRSRPRSWCCCAGEGDGLAGVAGRLAVRRRPPHRRPCSCRVAPVVVIMSPPWHPNQAMRSTADLSWREACAILHEELDARRIATVCRCCCAISKDSRATRRPSTSAGRSARSTGLLSAAARSCAPIAASRHWPVGRDRDCGCGSAGAGSPRRNSCSSRSPWPKVVLARRCSRTGCVPNGKDRESRPRRFWRQSSCSASDSPFANCSA
jgi:hypothetical protein